MNIIFRLLDIQKYVGKLAGNIEKVGWYDANLQYITDIGIRVSADLENFPKKGGALVYANHLTGLDPFLLSSILGRDDVYFLSDNYHAGKGNRVQEHMISIYYSSWKELLYRSGLSFFGFIFMRLNTGFTPREEAKKKNIQAVETAVEHLSKGHVVLVFPSGGNKEKSPWKKGIGEDRKSVV